MQRSLLSGLPFAGDHAEKEMYFVIDHSCSQSGLPMEKQKGIIHEALDHLNPSDTFNIVTFNLGVNFFSPRSLPNTPANVRAAKAFVDGIQAPGGTEMVQAVIQALDAPRDPERLRMVLFLTDGYVGNDEEIIHAVEQHIGNARLFTYGVGSSVNEHLSAQQHGGEKPEIVQAITETALTYRLTSAYTSFVAVDDAVRTGQGAPMVVNQPVLAPEGTDRNAFGRAEAPARTPQMPPASNGLLGGVSGVGTRGGGLGGLGYGHPPSTATGRQVHARACPYDQSDAEHHPRGIRCHGACPPGPEGRCEEGGRGVEAGEHGRVDDELPRAGPRHPWRPQPHRC